jgi:hypothetical protein
MTDRSNIDPRYDPAFQRGYTGEVKTGQHPHGVVRSSRTPAREEVKQPERATSLPTELVPPAYAAPTQEAVDDEVELVEDEADEQLPPRPLTRNPYLLVLALLGAALVVAGASWAIAGRSSMTESGSFASERDYWFVQAALVGAPITIASGVLIIAGVLFVFANAWNRGR